MTRHSVLKGFCFFFSCAALITIASAAWGEVVGTVAVVEGDAEIGREGLWTVGSAGTAVAIGDQLRTGRPGRMRIVFRDDSVLSLGEDSTLVVDEQVFDPGAAGAHSLFHLVAGTIKAVVSPYYSTAGSTYEVKTETAVAGVRGTEFVIDYDPETGKTEVVGIRGVVTVHGTADPTAPGLLVTASEATAVGAGELPSEARPVDAETIRRLQHEMDFFGSSQGLSLTEGSAVIAGAAVPRPARAPATGVGWGGALVGSFGPPVALDAGVALGNSPAAIIGGSGSGSINVNVGRR